MDALCIGNATLDIFINLRDGNDGFAFDKFSNQITFRLGEKIKVDRYTFSLGGNACNVAVGLSRLGLSSSLAAEVGSDDFSNKIINSLTQEKVIIDQLGKDSSKVPFFNILLSYMGERAILEEDKPADSELTIEKTEAKLIYLTSLHGNWENAYNTTFSLYEDSIIAMNPGSSQLQDKERLLPYLRNTDIVFVNVSEAQDLTEENSYDPKLLLQKLSLLGPKTVVITDAMNGAYASDSESYYQIPSYSSKPAKERTGAGDSFATGFLYGYINTKKIPDCLKYACLNSNSVIDEIGAQKGLLTKDEIERQFTENLDFQAARIS